MTRRDIFMEKCQGVTPEEMGALITTLMQPEFKKGVSTSTNKRVERYEGNIMGAKVNLTAVTTHFGTRWASDTEYTLENFDWELSVMTCDSSTGSVCAKIGTKLVYLYNPILAGDNEIYRHQMTILKLAVGMYL